MQIYADFKQQGEELRGEAEERQWVRFVANALNVYIYIPVTHCFKNFTERQIGRLETCVLT